VSGRSVVVTGAGSGMGAAMAAEFARLGDRVVALDRDLEGVRQVADAVSAEHGDGACRALPVDVGDPASVEQAMAGAANVLGGVDVLCSNAGVLDDYRAVLDTPLELWDRVLATNLTGAYLMTRAVLPAMLASGGGAIVYTASISGFIAGGGGAAYTSAKHGLVGLARQVAFDYGRSNVRANAVCPGPVRSGMTEHLFTPEGRQPHVDAAVAAIPAGRWAEPVEIAKLAAFLASDDASFIHGAAYVIDGGWTIS
jgi:3-oxoacyl-[acyl-carrier protein] reductase